MKETAFLVAVKRVVRRIEVQDQPPRSLPLRLDEDAHKETVHRLRVDDNSLVAAVLTGVLRRQLKAVQGALAGQRLAAIAGAFSTLTGRIRLPLQGGQERVLAQLIVVVQIFIELQA